MPLFGRSDGDIVRGLPLVRRIMPYIMRTRSESVVYHDTSYLVGPARAWLDAFNAARPGAPPATLFHLFLWSCARALHRRPGLNRFVSGGDVYQRRGVFLSFAAKRAFRDDAPIVTCKVEVPEDLGFAAAVARFHGTVGEGRSGKELAIDKELKLTFTLPSVLVGWGVRLLQWLDGLNLMPAAMIRPDPMYASVFLANLGSVGIDHVTHHLYEYGNVGIFGAMGKAGPHVVVGDDGQPAVRDVVEVRWTFDERINDGFYCAASLGLVREAMEDPTGALGDPVAAAKATPPG